MDALTYPNATWQDPATLLQFSGDFWQYTFAGRAELGAFIAGVGHLCEQNKTRFAETVNALSRHKVKNTKRYLLYPVTLYRSQMLAATQQQLTYGAGEVFASPANAVFGGSYGVQTVKFPVPTTWRTMTALQAGVVNPSWGIFANIGFFLDSVDGYLVFKSDPFADDKLTAETVQLADGTIDTAITLFAVNLEVQDDTAYTHFGLPLGLPNSTHPNYLQFLNAYADSIYCGPAHEQLCRMLSAVCDIPIAEEDETVEAVLVDSDGTQLVVTPKHCYRYPANNTLAVASGDSIRAGQTLSDAVCIYDLRNGEVPTSLIGITAGADLLAPAYVTGLHFTNADVPLVVDTEHASGKTFVSFTLGGHPSTVAQFWDDVHARGIADGTTLAELLDVRTTLPTQPTAGSLPAIINPAEFLIQNILQANTCIILIRPGLLPQTGMDFSWLRHIRRALPPHVLVLTIFELQAQVSSGKLTVTDELATTTDNPIGTIEESSKVTDAAVAPRYINISCL